MAYSKQLISLILCSFFNIKSAILPGSLYNSQPTIQTQQQIKQTTASISSSKAINTNFGRTLIVYNPNSCHKTLDKQKDSSDLYNLYVTSGTPIPYDSNGNNAYPALNNDLYKLAKFIAVDIYYNNNSTYQYNDTKNSLYNYVINNLDIDSETNTQNSWRTLYNTDAILDNLPIAYKPTANYLLYTYYNTLRIKQQDSDIDSATFADKFYYITTIMT